MATAPLVDNRKDSTDYSFTYKTVQLKDGNIWTAQNFNYFTNGDECQTFSPYNEYVKSHREDPEYGLYYEWQSLTPEVIPAGWHLPTVDEWMAVVNCYGGVEQALPHLLVGGSSGLDLDFTGGTYFKNQSCLQLARDFGFFWSATVEETNEYAMFLRLDKSEKKAETMGTRKSNRFNVRLVKDK